MHSHQGLDGFFWQVGIEFAEKHGEVIGIGRQVGKRGILSALIPCDGSFGIFSDRAIPENQYVEESLRRGFSVKGLIALAICFILATTSLSAAFRRRILRRVAHHDIPNRKDVPDPEIAKGILRSLHGPGSHSDDSRLIVTARQANKRKYQCRHRLMYPAHKALH